MERKGKYLQDNLNAFKQVNKSIVHFDSLLIWMLCPRRATSEGKEPVRILYFLIIQLYKLGSYVLVYRKSSITPPRGLFILSTFDGGGGRLMREGLI